MSALQLRDHGLWAEARTRALSGRGALFLDRDGVIVEERHYLHRVADVALTPGAAGVIAAANADGIPVVVITNQAGVGRGIYTWRDFAAVQDRMNDLLAESGAWVDAVYACAFHEAGRDAFAVASHPWRKPNPGMLQAAAADLDVALERSWVVGDRASDLMAGRSAGLAGGTLVATGYGAGPDERAGADRLASEGFLVDLALNLGQAFAPGAAGARFMASPVSRRLESPVL
jgi:D-glycero-D-manno-heptose 1,7-bisphosphate phosphatase